ncbi:unnamed protein product [Protopolystoma xenopodis]|uniref:Uncharacterized protein n=1 Tax=Protopolystoma xenopodis TaxID=117903 RepID=A0A448WGZ3_9PLAT|nr:unnamed protein product [Protopolystoma xenopodis]
MPPGTSPVCVYTHGSPTMRGGTLTNDAFLAPRPLGVKPTWGLSILKDGWWWKEVLRLGEATDADERQGSQVC